jgi:lipocalin-like protein
MTSLSEQLVGSWIAVSHEALRPDGSRIPVYGERPNGIAMFDASGRFIISVMRADRARYAIAHPAQGTADENKATAQGTMTYFGTYAVREAERIIDIHIEASSFPNWNGADQIRGVAIDGDELTLTVAALGGHAEVKWKRAG